jgi:hypothetical protein
MIHIHRDSLHDTLHAQKLLNHSNCAALISTHFHNLVAEIPPALATPMHMAAIVDEASASVTFLYKLVQGCRCLQLHHAHSVFSLALTLHAAVNLLVCIAPLPLGCRSPSFQVRRHGQCTCAQFYRIEHERVTHGCLQVLEAGCISCRAALRGSPWPMPRSC